MPTDAKVIELNSLVNEVREQVQYLKELGVEGLEQFPSDLSTRPVVFQEAGRSAVAAVPGAANFSTRKNPAPQPEQ